MPAPWAASPKEKWKRNFKGRVGAMVSNVAESESADAMAAGIAGLPDTPSKSEVKNSQRFANWQSATGSFTESAIKQAIVATAKGIPYDEASAGNFESVLDTLADKYERKFGEAWTPAA